MINLTNIPVADSGSTLSVFVRPGQQRREFSSASESIFSFGDFVLYNNSGSQVVSGYTQALHFDSLATLQSLNAVNVTPPLSNNVSVQLNELTLKEDEPTSYTYFGSFAIEAERAINNIISTYPYALLSYDDGNGTTIFDYSESFDNTTRKRTSNFKIPFSSITNQGGIFINSASTFIGDISLVTDYAEFALQLSGSSTAHTYVHDITYYAFSGDASTPYLYFELSDFLDGMSGSSQSTLPYYIRPTRKRFSNFVHELGRLEYHLLYRGDIQVPNIETDRGSTLTYFTWPRNIDGFNPDISGNDFTNYKDSLLKASEYIDETKTNIMARAFLPENFLDYDSENRIYATITQAYANEFDEIKLYIDNMAFAHSVTYSGEESVPIKFIAKLGALLGWELADSFTELDLFEYLAVTHDDENASFAYYNIEIWRRILINIVWLYKKKGTRDALKFIFKLLGAPDSLLRLDEFVYQINQSISTGSTKVDADGYVNYLDSNFIFQEGGPDRGNGFVYIDQWTPEFDPLKQRDDIKTYTANSIYFGTKNLMNTKEVIAGLDPAQAIEYDAWQFYQQSGTCWVWGSLAPPFSSLTVPFEYSPNNCDFVSPENMTGMTFSQWLDFIYTNNVNPRNRKTVAQVHTSFFYTELRNIYLNYYLWSAPESNRLTFHKLQSFLDLIELQFNTYFYQLIPATTILEAQGTIIRNTVFNRQKYVYKDGLNDGSEFRVELPPNFTSDLVPIVINGVINGYYNSNLAPINIGSQVNGIINGSLGGFTINSSVNSNLFVSNINGVQVTLDIYPPTTQSQIIGVF